MTEKVKPNTLEVPPAELPSAELYSAKVSRLGMKHHEQT